MRKLEQDLTAILKTIKDQDEKINYLVAEIHADYQLSAKNLCRYLMLRSFDLRQYHDRLSDAGVSALRSSEGYVLSNLQNVVKNLRLILGKPLDDTKNQEVIDYGKSKKLIKKHANALFNKTQKRNFTEIMVTLPDEAANDEEIIRGMVRNGMEIARINLSHGDLEMWSKMVKIVQQVREEFNQDIKIYMDLSGPKIRTAPMEFYSKKGKLKTSIPVRDGEHIHLTKRQTKGKKSVFGDKNEQIENAEVGVLLPNIIDDVEVNDVILFDDGMIKGVVVEKSETDIELVLTDCFKNKLGSNKGINLPNTQLNLPALTERDIELLPFVCENADIVGYSFVRMGEDVKQLYQQLDKYQADSLGVVFKIENQEAFQNLPHILLAGMKRNKIGVMIARGDLAVEIGFERISEVQNQILWLCEAAHIPVIWATQVLENLAKTGIPKSAEISDAAQSTQAECVMLNKGPHINKAISTLKNILVRMESHGFKKKNALRSLNIATEATKDLGIFKAILSPEKTLLEDIEAAKMVGYTEDFLFIDNQLKGRNNQQFYQKDQCKLVEYCRHEGMSDPSDSSILFLIECDDGTKGCLSSAYGMDADADLIDFVMSLER